MPRWRTVAPIWPEYPDANSCLSGRFEFGEGIFIGPASDWPLNASHLLELSFDHRLCAERARFAFAAEYEAQDREPDSEFAGRSKQEAANLRIQVANIAVWLARPTAIGFQTALHQAVFHQDGSEHGFLNTGLQPGPWWRIEPRPSYEQESLQQGDLELARQLYVSIRSLERNGAVWVSVFMLFKALSDHEWVIRFPLLWIALESIFGAEDGREIVHQLSERVALLLESGENARLLYRKTKERYVWRSKAVHGLRGIIGMSDERAEDLMLGTEWTIRSALKRILLDHELKATLNGAERDGYLSELAFREQRGAPPSAGPAHNPRTGA